MDENKTQNTLNACDTLSPLDNRYSEKVASLFKYFSNRAWIIYRVKVELIYFNFLYSMLPELRENLNKEGLYEFLNIYPNISRILERIAEIEKQTNHDIKAIEIALREHYDACNVGDSKYKEYIHFGLTSQDTNSVAFSLQLRASICECISPKLEYLIFLMEEKSANWKNITIVARTHGQAAIPTSLGKEFAVFIERLEYSMRRLRNFRYHTKIGGAVGTLAAHYLTHPEIDWTAGLNVMCKKIGLKRWQKTTQISNYEDIIELSQILVRINGTLIDFCQDIWLYISNELFILERDSENQVGSSTMPQKVNPINFENAEGNLKMANAGFNFFVEKLPVSRLQRDLTDSTVLRNYGVYLGHMLLALRNIDSGISKLKPNYSHITRELSNYPEMLGEAIQCLLRKHGVNNSYEIMRNILQAKKFLNATHLKRRVLREIEPINASPELKRAIMDLHFDNYLGNI
jgi:adenylosuccinate lyase